MLNTKATRLSSTGNRHVASVTPDAGPANDQGAENQNIELDETERAALIEPPRSRMLWLGAPHRCATLLKLI
jgi:hypothetical protein